MAGNRKQIEFAKKLLEISIEDGEVNPERVTAILEELKKNPPAKYPKVLRAYLKLVKKEIKKIIHVGMHFGTDFDRFWAPKRPQPGQEDGDAPLRFCPSRRSLGPLLDTF